MTNRSLAVLMPTLAALCMAGLLAWPAAQTASGQSTTPANAPRQAVAPATDPATAPAAALSRRLFPPPKKI